MTSRHLHRVLLACLVAVASDPARADIPPTERATLLSLYATTDGANWNHNEGWITAVDGTECSWHGVYCNVAGTHVTFILLAGDNLAGTLPALDGLAELTGFIAGNCHLTGALPALDQLAKLEIFDVSRNQLTGPIPSLTGLTQLFDFEVWDNQLTGSLPSLSGLASLNGFYAFNNKLTGTIPSLAGLVNLAEVHVYNNQLTGSIPALAGLALLSEFEVEDNLLTGPIPDLTGLPLTILRVGGNHLDGPLPIAPTGLQGGASSLCVNAFPLASYVDDASWDAASGTIPWYAPCNAVYANGFEAP